MTAAEHIHMAIKELVSEFGYEKAHSLGMRLLEVLEDVPKGKCEVIEMRRSATVTPIREKESNDVA